jgi:monofunctional biosynthetic peptidoglycan transglycosylase
MNRSPRPALLAFPDRLSVTPFQVVNDGVMGGVSSSRVSYADSALIFEGLLSLENRGGFASFRGPVTLPHETKALRVHLRGDGRRYKLTLKIADPNARWQYQAPFETTGSWQMCPFEASDFTASFRGTRIEAPPLRFDRVATLGVLISDRQAGPFRLEIREVLSE